MHSSDCTQDALTWWYAPESLLCVPWPHPKFWFPSPSVNEQLLIPHFPTTSLPTS